MNNSIFSIHPYRTEHGVWVFDDSHRGLQAEPFVGEINPMLDALTEFTPRQYRSSDASEEASHSCTLMFSASPMPKTKNKSLHLTKQDGDEFGSYYTVKEFDDATIWLCPALYKYFDTAPADLYIIIVN